MIHTLATWPQPAQEAVRRSLARRYLIRRIQEIRQVHTSGSQLVLSVLTEGGPAKLRLEKPGEGCQDFGAHGLLLTDPEGNYYVIPDRSALPRRQQRLLTLYFGDDLNVHDYHDCSTPPMPITVGEVFVLELDADGHLPSRPPAFDTLSSDTPSLDASMSP